jgi:site-specific recombinase XerD
MALNLEDVLLSEGQLRVRGKGSKMRFLPLAPETTQLIDYYPHDARRFTLPVPLPSPHYRRKNR